MIDKSLCIGCGKCLDACPYGVRSFDPFVKAGKDPKKQAADKCDMCAHRVDNGVEPACVNTCQGRSRIFGDLNDPDSEVSKLVNETQSRRLPTTCCFTKKALSRTCSTSIPITC